MADVKPARKRRTGKNTNDPMNYLPALPNKRSKPTLSDNKPAFALTINKKPRFQQTEPAIDLISELSKRDPRKQTVRSSRVPKVHESAGSTLSPLIQPKKDREAFRRALVEIIMQSDPSARESICSISDLPISARAGSPTAAEKDILRYYYYIHNGIDTEHVAPMEEAWLSNVLDLIPDELKADREDHIEKLSDEMKDDYLLSVKKAIVDFVLRDPRERDEDKKVILPEHRQELLIVPKPWKQSFLHARDLMWKNLHAINPCMLQVLDLWHYSFSSLRFIDISEFHKREESMELQTFRNLCMRQMDIAKERLFKRL